VAHLTANGCTLLRSGGRHDIWGTPGGPRTPVARHRQIPRTTAREICKLLGIPPI